MNDSKIARLAYKRARQADLAIFAENLVARMTGVAAYTSLQPQVQALTVANGHYREALAAARNRGQTEVLAKNLARQETLRQVNTLATALETLANGNAQLIVDAGFTLLNLESQRYTGQLSAPTILRAASTGKRGELRLAVSDALPQAVRMHAVEYSVDRGATWKNGAYSSRLNFVAQNLPHGPEVWVHVKSLGRDGRDSAWSETVTVAVL